jgi:hypothetical protein
MPRRLSGDYNGNEYLKDIKSEYSFIDNPKQKMAPKKVGPAKQMKVAMKKMPAKMVKRNG